MEYNYQVLARKWRPRRFQDVIGQAHITKSLQNAVLRGNLGHAYIMAGTRGIGKTSVARILGKAIRCEQLEKDGNPCGQCAACLDFDTGSSMNVLEIDGASNNSVDNIRELIASCQYVPTFGRYKVYIIDEVHMLSVSAFNALLKTLEEPPPHAVFILATTEPDKLLGTVLSRCQRFDFRHVPVDDLKAHVKAIAGQEKIFFENDWAIKQICLQGKGSVRDTLSLLDQVLSFSEDGHINEEVLLVALGMARLSAIREMVLSILRGDARKCSLLYKKLLHENVETQRIVTSVLDYLFEIVENIRDVQEVYKRELLPTGALNGISMAEMFWIYEILVKDSTWILSSIAPDNMANILFQKVCLRRTFFKQEETVVDDVKEIKTGPSETEEKKEEKKEQVRPVNSSRPLTTKSWDGFIKYLYSVSLTLATNLEQGNILTAPQLDQDKVVIDLGFGQSSKVFLDYLQGQEVKNRLTKFLSDYFEYDVSNVVLNFKLLDDIRKKESNFLSKVEQRNRDESLATENKKKEFSLHPLLKEAEQIFNNKVDKIILNNE